MSTSTLTTLIDRLSQRVGDYLQEALTTALTTTNVAVCNSLGNYTSTDDTWIRWWFYVVDKANATAYRKVGDYTASNMTLTLKGAAFGTDGSNLATVQLMKYDRNNKIRAINQAARKVWPNLFRLVKDTTLVTHQALPNAHFEGWNATTSPDYFTTLSNATANATTTAGLHRGARKSALVTATGTGGYMAITSSQYPQLLDLQGETVSFYSWAYPPSTANDGYIVIYTIKKDGTTTQTLTSTTTCAAAKWTLLKLEDQTLNSDLSDIQFRFKVATSGQTCYFDNARVFGVDIHDYVLPLDLQNPLAYVNNVRIQTSAISDEYSDDLLGFAQFEPLWGWITSDDATTKYLTLPGVDAERLVQVEGIAPLESNLSAATDTMTIEDPYLDLLIEYAAHLLMDMEAGSPSSVDRQFLQQESMEYLASYNMMARNLKMSSPPTQQRFAKEIL